VEDPWNTRKGTGYGALRLANAPAALYPMDSQEEPSLKVGLVASPKWGTGRGSE